MNPQGSQFDADFASTLSPAELAGQLLEQSYSAQSGFAHMHLDEIEAFFSETQPTAAELPSTFDGPSDQRELALNYFCFLLFALEINGSDSGETLLELAGREQGTRIITHHGFKIPKPAAVAASPSVSANEEVEKTEVQRPSEESDLDLVHSDFDGPFNPEAGFTPNPEADLTPIEESESALPVEDLFDETAPRVLAENTVDPWTEVQPEAKTQEEAVSASSEEHPWEIPAHFESQIEQAIQPVWNDSVETETPPAPGASPEVPEIEPITVTNFPIVQNEAQQTASSEEPVNVETSSKKIPVPPPPPMKPGQRKPETGSAASPVAPAIQAHADVKSAPNTAKAQPSQKVTAQASDPDLNTHLELEDNNWIERQFAGIANQLAVEGGFDAKTETLEENTNTSSLVVEFKNPIEEKPSAEPALDVAFNENEEAAPTSPVETEPPSSNHQAPLSEVSESEPESTPSAEMAPVQENPVTRALCSEAREYVAVAGFLEGFLHRTDLDFPHHHLIRLSAQSLCHAAEAEWMNHFSNGLGNFWKDRANAISDLLDLSTKPVRLHPVLKSAVDSIADANRGLLADEKFPHAAVVASLQYILGFEDYQKAKLTLIDMGTLLFFFGSARTLGGLSLSNRLGVVGLDRELTVELAFRLTRMHRLRSRSNSIKKPFSQADLLVLSQDATRCVELLGGSHSEDSALHAIQVA